jgi:hypothetical protein
MIRCCHPAAQPKPNRIMNSEYSTQLDAADIEHAVIHFSEVKDTGCVISIDRQSAIYSNHRHELVNLAFENEDTAREALDALNLRDDDEFCDTATLLINGEDKMNKGRWL